MSKAKYSARVEEGLDEGITAFKEDRGIEEDSEAVRQLVRRGLEATDGGETQSATGVSYVTITAGIAFIAAAVSFAVAVAFNFDPRLVKLGVIFAGAALVFLSVNAVRYSLAKISGWGNETA